MPLRRHLPHRHHHDPMALPQVELGNFGFWSWPGQLTPLESGEGASQLLIVTDAPDSDPGPQARVSLDQAVPTTMLGFARLFKDPLGQRMEDWRQPPGGYPGTFWMFPYYSQSRIEGLVRRYFLDRGLLYDQSDSWESAFPHSQCFPWPGFSDDPRTVAWTDDRFRVVRHFASPQDTNGQPCLLQSGAPVAGGTWHLGPDTWFSRDGTTVRLEMEHHLRMERLQPGEGLVYGAQPIVPGGSPGPGGDDPGARRSARRPGRRAP